jgi:hypothetical protein
VSDLSNTELAHRFIDTAEGVTLVYTEGEPLRGATDLELLLLARLDAMKADRDRWKIRADDYKATAEKNLVGLLSLERLCGRLSAALKRAITCAGPWNGTTAELGKSPAICPSCLEAARAALRAAATEEEIEVTQADFDRCHPEAATEGEA